ncbi:MAG: cysteine--tRNA ligase [Rickettsiales bacterium]|jgi:cysteinyl-tRNA synthetase|nr:cysteine--tRNA ligase [Rickettsiales bacterium]
MPNKIYFSNSLTGLKEEFKPLDTKHITMYVCGPTVYNRPHIGNARSIVVYDLLYRFLKYEYPRVTYVRNITDIDDKIIDAAKQENIPITQLTDSIIHGFHDDITRLNVLEPTFEPKATENLEAIINLIEKLLDNQYAYIADGHVLFDVTKYKEYGQLSGKKISDLISGSRVKVADYKRNALDFVLWKPSNPDVDESVKFNSPWGIGRPGWHIECSAMAIKLLGANFDIHGGGADLKFPHHENEIAQSCCADIGSKYAKYWIHNGFLTVNSEKMSKSLGNFTTVQDLLAQDVKGSDLRFFFLTAHYKKPLDFNHKSLDDAIKQNQRFNKLINDNIAKININNLTKTLPEEFVSYISDDLNTPKVISLLNKTYKHAKTGDYNALIDLYKICQFLAILNINEDQLVLEVPSEILRKAELIKQCRIDKQYAEADSIRDDIQDLDYKLEYLPDGNIKVTRKNDS